VRKVLIDDAKGRVFPQELFVGAQQCSGDANTITFSCDSCHIFMKLASFHVLPVKKTTSPMEDIHMCTAYFCYGSDIIFHVSYFDKESLSMEW
jgi:hypothetical protein